MRNYFFHTIVGDFIGWNSVSSLCIWSSSFSYSLLCIPVSDVMSLTICIRSLHGMANKRMKPEFPRVLQRMPSSARYTKNAPPVP